jgi:phytoene dehydrogenase-like protein
MSRAYEAIIIGAGISGLVCANYLAKSGMKVLVVERRKKPGGYCVSFERDGFGFDVCRHLGGFGTGGVMRFICSDIGIYKSLGITRCDLSDIIIIGSKKAGIFSDISKTKNSFKEAMPEESGNIDLFFGFVSGLNVFEIVAKYSKDTFMDILNRFFINGEVKNLFCALLGNAGLGPSQLSAVKGLLLYNQFILDGGYYMPGGNGRFPEALLDGLKRKGGEALFNTAVKKIGLNNSKAEGVFLESGEFIASDYTVSACDATETFMELMGESYLDKNFIKQLKSLIPSISVFTVFLGIEGKSYEILKHKSSIWYDPLDYSPEDNFATTYNEIHNGELNVNSGRVVITPTFSDKGDKRMALTLYIAAPYKDPQFWDEHKESFCENVINRAERLLPGISNGIRTKVIATPHTFYKYTLNKNGAMYGWASIPGQIDASVMPSVTPIDKLFLCGHWTSTGFGQGGVMSSAYAGMRTAEHMLKQRR